MVQTTENLCTGLLLEVGCQVLSSQDNKTSRTILIQRCPQGGVLSPLLWNLVVDRILSVTNDVGFNTFGYADDIVITVQGKLAYTVRDVMQQALNVVVKWA